MRKSSFRRSSWSTYATSLGKHALHVIVAGTLFGMLSVTVVDVTGRYFFGRPLPAAYEITELMLAIMVFGAMPLAALGQGHITISILEGFFKGKVERIRLILISFFCALASFGLAYEVLIRSMRIFNEGDHTLFLKAPIAPIAFFITGMSVIMGGVYLFATQTGALWRATNDAQSNDG